MSLSTRMCFWLVLVCGVGNSFAGCTDYSGRCPMPGCCRCENKSEGVRLVCEPGKTARPEERSFCQQTRIPSPLPHNLSRIEIRQNWIKKIRKTDFKGCYNLERIFLVENEISAVEPDAFLDLKNLKTLGLNTNKLDVGNESSLPRGLLAPLSQLDMLWIGENIVDNLHSYRQDFFVNKKNLRVLSFDAAVRLPLPKLSKDRQLSSLNRIVLVHHQITSWGQELFSNWSMFPVKYLQLGAVGEKSGITNIKKGACSVFPSLEALDLSYNTFLKFGHALMQCLGDLPKSVTHLKLNAIVPNPSSEPTGVSFEFMEHLKRLNLRRLELDNNGIYAVGHSINATMSLNQVIPNIQYLSLAYNRFFAFMFLILTEIHELRQLKYLNVCCQSRASNFRHELVIPEVGLVGFNPFYHDANITINWPPKLKYLHLAESIDKGNLAIRNIRIMTAPGDLNIVDMSSNKITRIYGPLVIDHNRTHRIDVLNFTSCMLARMNPRIFQPHLEINVLDLSRNIYLGEQIQKDVNGTLMFYMSRSKVRVLNLTLTNIRLLPENFFQYATTLKELVIRNSALSAWYNGISLLPSLRLLDLSENKILYLLDDVVQDLEQKVSLEQHRPFSLGLSDNPLRIGCENLVFLKWMARPTASLLQNESIVFYERRENRFEHRTMNDLVALLPLIETNCAGKTWVKVTGALLGVSIVGICLATVIYRKRWDFKFFMLNLVRERRAYARLQTPEHRYDAFVVYHRDDLLWVKNMLLPRLEQSTGRPFKLCLHDRDWLPGYNIEDNICQSINDSRKTVFIATRQSVRSSWCEFEIQMARMRGIDEGEDIIIVVSLEEIPMALMTSTLANLRRSSTWLEWDPSNGEEEDLVFWTRLREAIAYPSNQPMRCSCGRTYYPDGTSHHV